MNKVDLALVYLDKGYSVIPLKSPEIVMKSNKFKEEVKAAVAENSALENPRTADDIFQELFYRECKKPLVAWKEYQTRFPTKEEVINWFTKNPDANIGIVTGELSDLVVFDQDSEEAIKFAEEKGGFPDNTPKAKTGKENRYHVYMQHPGFEIRNDVNKKYDIDIRGDGGFVVAPPSIHGSGNQYAWIEGCSILDVDPAECSTWMVEYLKGISIAETKPKNETKSDSKNKPASIEPDHTPDKSGKKSFADLIANGVVEGERNHTAVKIIGLLLKTMSKDNAWAFAMAWNKNNKPPLLKDELKGIFETVCRLENKKEISIDSLLDTPESILEDYNQNYARIPFARDTLAGLEKKMNGGLIPKKVYGLGGSPSSGKSALVNNIADNICLNGYPVLLFTLDDSKSDYQFRTLSRFGKHDINAYSRKQAFEIDKVLDRQDIKKIFSLKYVFEDDIPISGWTDFIEQITKRHDLSPVVIIDFLRKVNVDSGIGDPRLRIDEIVGKLINLAKEMNVAIIFVSELARDSYRLGNKLGMASCKESGSIEYEASWLGFLAPYENKDNVANSEDNIDLIVVKSKGGTGTRGTVQLKLKVNKMTFTDRNDGKTSTNAVYSF